MATVLKPDFLEPDRTAPLNVNTVCGNENGQCECALTIINCKRERRGEKQQVPHTHTHNENCKVSR